LVPAKGSGGDGPGGRSPAARQPPPLLGCDDLIVAGLLEPFEQPEFSAGLEAAVVALAAAVLIGAVWRSRSGRPAPVGGLLLSAAGVVALTSSAPVGAPVPEELIGALVLLAIGGFVADLASWRPVRFLLPIPGAFMLATDSGLPDVAWIRILAGVTAVVGGALVADFDTPFRRRRNPALPLLAISAVGVYYTVPDTEQALVLLAVCLVMTVAAWPLPLVSLGTSGAFAAVGLFSWVVAVGGVGRHSAIVGGVACLALLVVEPFSRVVMRSRREPRGAFDRWSVLPLAALQLAFVAFAARVVGLRPTVAPAVWLAVAELAVAMATLLALRSASRHVRKDSRP
jgi:hypothetical protein